MSDSTWFFWSFFKNQIYYKSDISLMLSFEIFEKFNMSQVINSTYLGTFEN